MQYLHVSQYMQDFVVNAWSGDCIVSSMIHRVLCFHQQLSKLGLDGERTAVVCTACMQEHVLSPDTRVDLFCAQSPCVPAQENKQAAASQLM